MVSFGLRLFGFAPRQFNRYRAAEAYGKELRMAAWCSRSLIGPALSARLFADEPCVVGGALTSH
jgi:hypothetical protein